MTELLDRAVQTIRALPPATQHALAPILLQLASDDPSPLQLTDEEESSFDASFAEAERGGFASDDGIKAIWAKHDL
jgi:hypothetical protein